MNGLDVIQKIDVYELIIKETPEKLRKCAMEMLKAVQAMQKCLEQFVNNEFDDEVKILTKAEDNLADLIREATKQPLFIDLLRSMHPERLGEKYTKTRKYYLDGGKYKGDPAIYQDAKDWVTLQVRNNPTLNLRSLMNVFREERYSAYFGQDRKLDDAFERRMALVHAATSIIEGQQLKPLAEKEVFSVVEKQAGEKLINREVAQYYLTQYSRFITQNKPIEMKRIFKPSTLNLFVSLSLVKSVDKDKTLFVFTDTGKRVGKYLIHIKQQSPVSYRY